jgi:hypothetical protein
MACSVRLLLAAAVAGFGWPAAAAEPTDWPYYRHDRGLSARSPARGDMSTTPAIKWRYYLGGWQNRFVIGHAPGAEQTVPLASTPSPAPAWDGVPLVDLAGNSRLVLAPAGKVGKLLPDVRGLQSVEWALVPGKANVGVGRCYSYEDGPDKPRLRWQTEEEPEVYEMLYALGDVEGDGRLDVVFVTHYRAIVYDGRTGKKKSTIKWPIGRNYGQITLADVDGDGRAEIVVVADSPPHVDVLRYRPGEGELVWSHRYVTDAQVSLPLDRKLYLVADHVRDVDGDGRLDIVYNRHDDEQDHRWHVIVRDARTGREMHNLPGLFLFGVADLGGGPRALCCLEAPGRGVPESGKAKILEFHDGKWQPVWEAERARWPLVPATFPASACTIASLGPVSQRRLWTLDVDGDGREDVLVIRGERITAAVGYNGDGPPVAKWEAVAPAGARCEVEAVSAARREVLIRADAEQGEVRTHNARGRWIDRRPREDWSPLPARPLPLVADLDGDGRNAIVVQDSRWATRVLRVPPGKRAPELVRALPGGGLWLGRRWEGFPYSKFPVFTADLLGDGRREILLTDAGEEAVSTVSCWTADGRRLWVRPLPGTPARSIVWMMDGRFRERGRNDLFVVVQDGSIGDCFCLDGRTGAILYRMGEQRIANGTPFRFGSHSPFVAAADLDGDGLDDLTAQSGQYLSVIRGKDGRPIVPPRNLIGDLFPRWVMYGINTVGDWDGSGRASIFTNTTSGGFGLVSPRLERTWDRVVPTTRPTLVGTIGRPERAGGWVFATFDGATFRTFDMKTGKPVVAEELQGVRPDSTAQVICADIDGDGRDDFLTTGGQRLLCIRGDAGPGPRVKWSLPIPSAASDLLVADVDGDGKLDILFTGTDGYLYCVGRQP